MPTFTDKWLRTAEDNEADWRAWTAGMDVREILEVGSFEGRSALLWHRIHPQASILCLDSFASAEHGDDYETRFDENTNGYPIRKWRGFSADALPQIADTFDIIYIDGDHSTEAVKRDAELSWPRLRPGGLMIFDDYELRMAQNAPAPGIDAFLTSIEGQYELVGKGWQVCIRRTV